MTVSYTTTLVRTVKVHIQIIIAGLLVLTACTTM